jgi:hypothetical protein
MKLLTCTGCKLDRACARADQMRAALKGNGVLSVKFACKDRQPVFAPGDAALFTTFVTDCDPNEMFGGRVVEVTYPGVVIEQVGSKVIGFIKAGIEDNNGEGLPFEPRGNGYVKMPLRRVRRDETRPPTEIKTCQWCASHYAISGVCNFDPDYTPKGQCFATPPAS